MSKRQRTMLPAFPDAERSLVYIAAGRALAAGLPPDRALEASVELTQGRAGAALKSCAALVRRGSSMVASLSSKGLVQPLDRAILESAERSGQLDAALTALGRHYEGRHRRFSQLKGRLLFPAAVFLLAILIGPLPALVVGDLSLAGYLWRCALVLIVLYLSWTCIASLRQHSRGYGWPAPLIKFGLRLPLVGRLISLDLRINAFTALHLMLSAGLPAHEAIQTLRTGSRGSYRTRLFTVAQQSLVAGSDVSTALADTGLLEAHTDRAILSAAEAAGRLDSALAHLARGLEEELEDWHRGLAVWIPGLAYATVSAYIAAGFF